MTQEKKWFGDSPESEAEEGQEFDRVICCALERAFEMNRQVTKKLEDIVDDDISFKAFRNMLREVRDDEELEVMEYAPEPDLKMVCSQIA